MLQLLRGDPVSARRAVPICVALLGACVLAVACGGVRKASAPAPAMSRAEGVAPVAGDPRSRIEALDRQIADDMARAQIPPVAAPCSGAACAEAMSRPFATPTPESRQADPQCRPSATPACTDTCTLATSICSNQQKICDLAHQLEGDDWAAGKCESARASCKAANDRCCGCA
jgi:hypothetical protein